MHPIATPTPRDDAAGVQTSLSANRVPDYPCLARMTSPEEVWIREATIPQTKCDLINSVDDTSIQANVCGSPGRWRSLLMPWVSRRTSEMW